MSNQEPDRLNFLQRLYANKTKLFAYILVLFLAIIFFLSSLLAKDGSDAEDIFRSLSTDFVGVFLIFLLVDFFFGSNENRDIAEKLDRIDKRLDPMSSLTVDERESLFEVTRLLNNTKQLDVIGYSLVEFLRSHHIDIVARIQAGAKFRFILLDPESEVRKIAEAKSTDSTNSLQTAQICLTHIEDDLTRIPGEGSFEYVKMDRQPYASVMLFRSPPDEVTMRLVLYPMCGPTYLGPGRLCIMVNKHEHENWVTFYEQQFERLWEEYHSS